MLSQKQRLLIQRLPIKANKVLKSSNLTVKFFFSGLDYGRFGVIISKKTAKLAVRRNQLRRFVFNFIKNKSSAITPADYLIIINKDPGDLSNLEKELKTLF